jgi:putative membrane protein
MTRNLVRILMIAFVLSALSLPFDGKPLAQSGIRGAQGVPRIPNNPLPAAPEGSAISPVVEAIEMNLAQIEFGKLAFVKAQDGRVKLFGDTMVKDHSSVLPRLRQLQEDSAADVNLNASHQAAIDHLSKLLGAAFDREYLSEMVSEHQAIVLFLERQSQLITPLSKLSVELLPIERQHLQQAQQIHLGFTKTFKTTWH